ncbi:MAG: GGDEF domain-containing protein [Wenzhouxiangellaceae bacterium]|nr:GGDEF domain-containing protein [Wenzhouxiangellaceae bacterium]
MTWRGLVVSVLLAGLGMGCSFAFAVVDGVPMGRPAVQDFQTDVDVYPRFLSVVQGPSGLVYVGGAEGLLSFDGARWEKFAINQDEVARALAHDGQSRLYVGGYNAFGYFETPLAQGAGFVDLSARFDLEDPDFADIWQILVAPEGVFFLALNDLFWLDPDSGATRHWHNPGRFGAISRFDGEIWLQYRGEGLRAWRDGDFVAVAASNPPTGQLFEMIALPGGGALTLGRDGRWLRVENGDARTFEMPEGFPESSRFSASQMLDGGLLALGSTDGWLYFLDLATLETHSFRLSRDWISDLEISTEGGLIAQTDSQSHYVRWPSQWTALGSAHGLTGGVQKVLPWNDRWLVISDGGARLGGVNGSVAFEAAPWGGFEAWDFHPLGDGTGLLADSYALKHVDLDGVLASLDIQYPRSIEPSLFAPGYLYIGTDTGIAVVHQAESGPRVVFVPADDAAPVFSMVELGPRELLLGSQGRGVLRARFSDNFEVLDVVPLGPDSGIEYDSARDVEMRMIDAVPHALTGDGFWRWNGADFERVDLGGLEALRRNGRYIDVRQSPDGSLWAFDFNHLYRFFAERGWIEMQVGPLVRGALTSVSFLGGGHVAVGASASVLLFDPEPVEREYTNFEPMLRSVRLENADGIAWLDPAQPQRFDEQSFSIRFEYALPGLDSRDEIRYQARLRGYESQFTAWEKTSHYTYSNLVPGAYAFEINARDPLGRVQAVEPFQFEIVPPWYRSSWAMSLRWLGVSLVLALLIWLLMRARLWRLEAERSRLSAKVIERTAALVTANRKLKQIAEKDELTGIPNRRSFDRFLSEKLLAHRDDGRPLSLALIDLDRFKPFNDRHGHLAGDRALCEMAECLSTGFAGEQNLVARIGGDEFVAVLPGLDLASAVALAEQARQHCATLGHDLQASIGIASLAPGQQADAQGLLGAADQQLYASKRAGRNAVMGEVFSSSSHGG